MSWFVAACFPGLLMISTYGLQRIESVMHRDRPGGSAVVSRIEQAVQDALAAREMAAALSVTDTPDFGERLKTSLHLLGDEPGLPTRPNRLFQPTGSVNPV